jgi:hypothetical protein
MRKIKKNTRAAEYSSRRRTEISKQDQPLWIQDGTTASHRRVGEKKAGRRWVVEEEEEGRGTSTYITVAYFRARQAGVRAEFGVAEKS